MGRVAESSDEGYRLFATEMPRNFYIGAVEGLKYQEIAHALGISVNTVKTQMKFAYRKVKSQVGSEMNVLIVMFWLSSRYF